MCREKVGWSSHMHVKEVLTTVRVANKKSCLRYHATYKCFVVGAHRKPKKIPGVHTQMQRAFKVMRGGWVGGNPNSTSGKEFKGGRTGRALGTQVDNELEKVCQGQSLRVIHPYTKKVLDAMRHWDLRLVACQVPIVWSEANTATAIDMVVCDKDSGEALCVELKTGFDGYEDGAWDNEDEQPNTFHDDILDTAHNRNSLQVCLTTQILKHGYGLKHAPNCSVWYVNRTGVHRRPPAPEVWDRRDELAEHLHHYGHTPPRKKRTYKKRQKKTAAPKKKIAKKKKAA